MARDSRLCVAPLASCFSQRDMLPVTEISKFEDLSRNQAINYELF